MKRIKNRGFAIGGLLLAAAALFFILHNSFEAQRGARAAEKALAVLESGQAFSGPEASPEQTETQAAIPAYVLDLEMEMPTKAVEGIDYIGVLEIPVLELSLPVISTWGDSALRLAPCRYKGSAYLDDLIIAGHNYAGHFGRLYELQIGDELQFTDAAGNCFYYSVSGLEELPGTAVAEMEAGDWDLSLFTCTPGGRARVTVRCIRHENI